MPDTLSDIISVDAIAHPIHEDSEKYNGFLMTREDMEKCVPKLRDAYAADSHGTRVGRVAGGFIDCYGRLRVTLEINAKKHPHLAHKLESGDYRGVSLGLKHFVDPDTYEVTDKTVLEISVCEEGDLPGTDILNVRREDRQHLVDACRRQDEVLERPPRPIFVETLASKDGSGTRGLSNPFIRTLFRLGPLESPKDISEDNNTRKKNNNDSENNDDKTLTMSETDQLYQRIATLNSDERKNLLAQLSSGEEATPRKTMNFGKGVTGQEISPDEIMNLAMNQFMKKMDAASGQKGASLEQQLRERDAEIARMREELKQRANQSEQKPEEKEPEKTGFSERDLTALLEKQMRTMLEESAEKKKEKENTTAEDEDSDSDDDNDENSSDEKEAMDTSSVEGGDNDEEEITIKNLKDKTKAAEEQLKAALKQKEEYEKIASQANERLRLLTQAEKEEESIEKYNKLITDRRKKQLEKIQRAMKFIEPVYMKDSTKQERERGERFKNDLNNILKGYLDTSNETEKTNFLKKADDIVYQVETRASLKALQGRATEQERELQKMKQKYKKESSNKETNKKPSPLPTPSNYSIDPSKCMSEIKLAQQAATETLTQESEEKGIPMDKQTLQKGVKRKVKEYMTFASKTWDKHPRKKYPKNFYPFADTILPEIKYGELDQFRWKEHGCPTPRQVLSHEALNMNGSVYRVLPDDGGFPPVIPEIRGRLLTDLELSEFAGKTVANGFNRLINPI